MYCLSLHALALDRQVMEAVWPNNMALGQIWAEKNRKAEGNRGSQCDEETLIRGKWQQARHHPPQYLQLGRHVPEADLSVMAACDDGAEVVHHQQTADAVGGSRAAPQHNGQNQAVSRHDADVSRRQRAAHRIRLRGRQIKAQMRRHWPEDGQ